MMSVPLLLRATPLLLLYSRSCSAAINCPSGWMPTANGSKCMTLTAPSTHEGCAAACGKDASLACIHTQEEDDLASFLGFLTFGEEGILENYMWTGEYQWEFEPTITFGFDTDPAQCPNNYCGQTGWGICSNGERSEWLRTHFASVQFQPNNVMGGEDCAAKHLIFGLTDNVCT